MNQSKYIYLMAGPSGSGKSSVARKITEWYGFKEVWSYTERPPRYAGEPGHIFVTPEEFDAAGPMCAFTLYNGYRYGVPQSEIDSSLLYVIDPAGIEYMKTHYAGSKGIAVIGIWAPEEARRERMISYGLNPDTTYSNMDNIQAELDFAMELYKKLGCPIINVANKSIEETATLIMESLKENEE